MKKETNVSAIETVDTVSAENIVKFEVGKSYYVAIDPFVTVVVKVAKRTAKMIYVEKPENDAFIRNNRYMIFANDNAEYIKLGSYANAPSINALSEYDDAEKAVDDNNRKVLHNWAVAVCGVSEETQEVAIESEEENAASEKVESTNKPIETVDTVNAENIVKFEVGKTYEIAGIFQAKVISRTVKYVTVEHDYSGGGIDKLYVRVGGNGVESIRIPSINPRCNLFVSANYVTKEEEIDVSEYAVSVEAQEVSIESEIEKAESEKRRAEKISCLQNIKNCFEDEIENVVVCVLGYVEKNEVGSKNAGYEIAENEEGDWVSYLGDRLEFNLASGETYNVWIMDKVKYYAEKHSLFAIQYFMELAEEKGNKASLEFWTKVAEYSLKDCDNAEFWRKILGLETEIDVSENAVSVEAQEVAIESEEENAASEEEVRKIEVTTQKGEVYYLAVMDFGVHSGAIVDERGNTIGEYADDETAGKVIDELVAAYERGDKTFAMPEEKVQVNSEITNAAIA